MNDSLSVFVPVSNAQATLSAEIARWLDILPDLSARFDVWLIDDASTDATAEIAHELTLAYPQVRYIRQTMPLGTTAAWRTALGRMRGDLILYLPRPGDVVQDDLAKLWWAAADHEVVIGLVDDPRMTSLGELNDVTPGAGIIRRRLLQSWPLTGGGADPLEHLIRLGVEPYVMMLRPNRTEMRAPTPQRHARDTAASGRPKRPNYLARLKALAWGE